MNKGFEDMIFEFVKEISHYDILRNVVLFGSVAKDIADKRSDIDIFIIFDTSKNVGKIREAKEISQLALKLEKKFDKNMQLVFSNKNFDKLDRQFIETAFKEGIILYGKVLEIKTGKLGLEPYFILNYKTEKLPSNKKMRLNRALFGYETRKTHRKKVYKTKIEGLVSQFDIQKIGLATLLVPYKKINIFTDLFENLGIKYNKLDIWISKV